MAADIISANYELLGAVSRQFDQQAQVAKQVLTQLNGQLATLKGGGWMATAADKFFQSMDDEVMPGMLRLHQALMAASEKSKQLVELYKQAEQDASAQIPQA